MDILKVLMGSLTVSLWNIRRPENRPQQPACLLYSSYYGMETDAGLRGTGKKSTKLVEMKPLRHMGTVPRYEGKGSYYIIRKTLYKSAY